MKTIIVLKEKPFNSVLPRVSTVVKKINAATTALEKTQSKNLLAPVLVPVIQGSIAASEIQIAAPVVAAPVTSQVLETPERQKQMAAIKLDLALSAIAREKADNEHQHQKIGRNYRSLSQLRYENLLAVKRQRHTAMLNLIRRFSASPDWKVKDGAIHRIYLNKISASDFYDVNQNTFHCKGNKVADFLIKEGFIDGVDFNNPPLKGPNAYQASLPQRQHPASPRYWG